MRRMGFVIIVVVAMALSYALGRLRVPSQEGGETGRRVLYYVDPKHPAYK